MNQPHYPPRIASAALPPGYNPESNGEPQVLLYFRIYAGIISFSGLVTTLFSVYKIVQERGNDSIVFWFISAGLGTIGLFTHLLGLASPRRPWMHTAGILLIGIGMLTSCLCWLTNIPLLLYWLRPEVKRWFDTAPQE